MVVTEKSMVSYLRVFLVGAACGAALRSYLKDRRLLHSYYGEATEIFALLMRRWNDSAAMLNKDEVYVPTGRNDPCPCGSGEKYKKCCGGAAFD